MLLLFFGIISVIPLIVLVPAFLTDSKRYNANIAREVDKWYHGVYIYKENQLEFNEWWQAAYKQRDKIVSDYTLNFRDYMKANLPIFIDLKKY